MTDETDLSLLLASMRGAQVATTGVSASPVWRRAESSGGALGPNEAVTTAGGEPDGPEFL